MYPRSGRFTTIPIDTNLGNLNLFLFKLSSLFYAKPSFVCFSFWILDIFICMWAGILILDGFGIRILDLKFCRLCPRCWWIVVIFEVSRSRWLIIVL